MWFKLGSITLKYRLYSIIIIGILTIFFGWKASQIQLSYEFNRAIPKSSDIYKNFEAFQKKFGGNADVVVVGIQTTKLFKLQNFNSLLRLESNLKQVSAVQNVVSAANAAMLVKDSGGNKCIGKPVFEKHYTNQEKLDSAKQVFESLPFYKGVLYNPNTNAYLIGITVNRDTANSKARTRLMNAITKQIEDFEKNTQLETYISGLPYIRTRIADRLKNEMNYFLFGSLLLSAVVLLIFFRSWSAMFLSLTVVGIGVLWCFGLMVLIGYKITLLSALIPPLIVVIGVPNCIYFLNKYHTSFKETQNKQTALVNMVGKMGIVTLFCNIAAAIGFAVFALTSSDLLKEFGIISGAIIMALFFISLLLIPAVLSYLPNPTNSQMRYLDNKLLSRFLLKVEQWAFNHKKAVVAFTVVALTASTVGLFKLKKEGFIVDDIPKKDAIYTHLKWFEANFKGIMPLEITIDTKKRKGLQRSMAPIEKIDEFSQYITANPYTSKPMSFVEGLKWVRQAYFDGDSSSYTIPNGMAEMALMSSFLETDSNKTQKKAGAKIDKLVYNFIDSNRQVARISVNMKDIGSKQLPLLLKEFESKSKEIFDTSKYTVGFTGSSITFVEGSSFIINGLKESIAYAFILIALCMLYLFKSLRILLCSLIPNIIPLVITAGVMGWTGIALKPSTVLVFSVALGIVIDITIRFLINYKQELSHYNFNNKATLAKTIQHTGISIIYTSLVLITGFIIFCFSSFGGTQALGWLTSLTLLTGTFTNLVLLPVLMGFLMKKQSN